MERRKGQPALNPALRRPRPAGVLRPSQQPTASARPDRPQWPRLPRTGRPAGRDSGPASATHHEHHRHNDPDHHQHTDRHHRDGGDQLPRGVVAVVALGDRLGLRRRRRRGPGRRRAGADVLLGQRGNRIDRPVPVLPVPALRPPVDRGRLQPLENLSGRQRRKLRPNQRHHPGSQRCGSTVTTDALISPATLRRHDVHTRSGQPDRRSRRGDRCGEFPSLIH